jgi:hypothetical protein
MVATETEGFWSADQPDDSNGGCVFAHKNSEDYVYDRPYTFSYSNCMILRAFICEKMAAPEGKIFLSFFSLFLLLVNFNNKFRVFVQ